MKKIFVDFNLEKIFKAAIFFLPSAPLISAILILISGIFSIFKRKNTYFSDKWNIPFFILGLLMIISTIFAFVQFTPYHIERFPSSIITSTFGISNLFFFQESGYFDYSKITNLQMDLINF